VFKIPPKAQVPFRIFAISTGFALFTYLVWRAGPAKLWANVLTMGWGFAWVLALTGVSHAARAWAWRMTLREDRRKIPFLRMLGLRLGAEAAGQLGLVGQTFGDSIRVSRLSSEIPLANGLASVSLDRGLYFVTGTLITITGILAAIPLMAHSHALRVYAGLFAFALIVFLLTALLAMRKRWPVFSMSARFIGRIPSIRKRMESKHLLIKSAEDALFDFHHKTPRIFWTSFSINLACQCMAVLEVCLILWLMGTTIGFFGTLGMEAFTKLVNLLGTFNPGNIGTYEGGTMLIAKMFGFNSATGLALGLARRCRSFFWGSIGVICLFVLTKPRRGEVHEDRGRAPEIRANDPPTLLEDPTNSRSAVSECVVAIILPNVETSASQSGSSLFRVGSLPILLRTILGIRKAGLRRIVVVIDPIERPRVEQELASTKRIPESVQWIDKAPERTLLHQLSVVSTQAGSKQFVLIDGGATYHPSLLRMASEWNNDGAALALTSGDTPIGIYALPAETICSLKDNSPVEIGTLAELHPLLTAKSSVVCVPVSENLWQRVITPEDHRVAEGKLDCWLVKPTDGIFARMNRKFSIPISRQLIKFPITANMVSIFTLGVGFAAGAFFARGGYWNMLLGAFLGLWASILDGCDGEVARLKLLESDFGCWLETVCDYLFYLFLFVGMTLGLWRNSGSRAYLACGGLLLFGAITSFLVTGWARQRLAAGRPEQLLGIWQNRMESRPSNPFMYLGRHLEFIIRRCFFPYALLFFALFNIMNVAFVLSALSANLVWPVALYSSRNFVGVPASSVRSPVASA